MNSYSSPRLGSMAVASGVVDQVALAAAMPVAMYATDATGRITYFNEAAAELWGRRPVIGDEWWCGSWRLFWPDGRPIAHDECPMAETLKTGTPVSGREAVLERPDGTRIPFLPFPAPIFDESGKLTGAINVLIEIGGREHVDSATHHLAAIVGSSDDAIISKTVRGVITSWNASAERLFGYSAQEAIGQSVEMLIPEDRRDEEPKILARIIAGERIEHFETIRRRKDGRLIDISLTISPIRDGHGKIIGASKIARDISERKRAEQTRELLLNELKHRVKNTLGTVQALVAQSFRTAKPSEHKAFSGRLRALAAAHDMLTREGGEQVEMKVLLDRALAPFTDPGQARFVFEGPDVRLRSERCLPLSLVLHELATNAVKYGALGSGGGSVHVSWAYDPAGKVRLDWREKDGPPVQTPNRRGFGTTLITRTFGKSAQISYAATGVTCAIELVP